jgi:hypothetical protein
MMDFNPNCLTSFDDREHVVSANKATSLAFFNSEERSALCLTLYVSLDMFPVRTIFIEPDCHITIMAKYSISFWKIVFD